jgi:hypothetical protein
MELGCLLNVDEGNDPFDLNMQWGYDGSQHDEFNGGLDHSGNMHQSTQGTSTAGGSNRSKTNLTNQQRDEIYRALLARSNCGRKSKECTRLVASTFNVNMRTVQRIWDRAQKCVAAGVPVTVESKRPKNCGRKKVVANLAALADIPLNERSTI